MSDSSEHFINPLKNSIVRHVLVARWAGVLTTGRWRPSTGQEMSSVRRGFLSLGAAASGEGPLCCSTEFCMHQYCTIQAPLGDAYVPSTPNKYIFIMLSF